MPLQSNIQQVEDGAVIYIIGSSMLDDKLRPFADELNDLLEDSVPIVMLDFESEDGSTITERYEIEEASLPAIIILESDETFYKGWYGEELPRPDDVVYEVKQITGASEE